MSVVYFVYTHKLLVLYRLSCR